MYLTDAVAVVVSGELLGAVGDGGVFAARIGHPAVSLCLVGVKLAARLRLALDLGLNLVNPCAEADR